MAQFTYSARDESGVLLTGEIKGTSADQIKNILADQGLFPVSVKSKEGTDFLKLFQRSVSKKVLIVFTRQLHTMFRAGVPMVRILEALYRQTSHPVLRRVLFQVQKDVMSGSSLAEAFGEHPEVFSDLYVSMIRVGEAGGALETTLGELSKVLYRINRMEAQVKSATLYPKIVLVTLGGVFVLMMTYLVPKFSSFYAAHGADLPMITKIAIGLSYVITHWWPLLIALGGVGFVVYKRYVGSRQGRLLIDRIKFKVPIFGRLQKMVLNERFVYLLTVLYRSGFSLSDSLTVLSDAVGNKAYALEIIRIKEDVERGKSLSESMAASLWFSQTVVEVTSIGEKSGSVDEMLGMAAEFFDEAINDFMKNLNTIVEPLLLFVVFLMVGFLAFSVFLPIWNLSNVVLPG